MSDVNKLDDKQCPFDLSKYKSNDVVAPIGSLPWAIIQVYMGKKVYRSNWNFPVEYIRLAGVTDSNPYIEKYTPNNPTHWQPTQEDMMACDWEQMDCMLSFDLASGSSVARNPSKPNEPLAWGYIINTDWDNHFGTLNIEPNNKVDIVKVWAFIWNPVIFYFNFDVETKPDAESRQKVIELFQNNDLRVTVGGIAYNLGKTLPTGKGNWGAGDYGVVFQSRNTETQKLGTLLQQMQQTGQTKRFCLSW
ncbi:hypothetical protein Xvie_03837 [Xenorhabdus vietnamensis]|uniref:Uncharacterized protein n=1 Tax=Xenorhabdus vietnamensis TaxID=351656 RepID=A0A1Y2S6N9_9GAMM|nr:MW1434 family type I TA system toxin [Xenorhabdus vietnamensis]OTA14318.1 hypothetical protein Xvie_03837 [Xenorhabdus vietnamensis]